jgi:hypothetical protein
MLNQLTTNTCKSSQAQGIPFGLSSPVIPRPDNAGWTIAIPGLHGFIMVG